MASASKQTRQRTGARVRPAGRGWRLIDSELDGVLLGTVIALLVIGILMMFSASNIEKKQVRLSLQAAVSAKRWCSVF